MTINQVKNEQALTLIVEGRLDTMTAPELEATLDKSLGGVQELTLDFENLEYVSSAGLRVILKAQKMMNLQGSMKLVKVRDEVKEVFEITGFADILTIE